MKRKKRRTRKFKSLSFRGNTRRGVGSELRFVNSDGNFIRIKDGRSYLNILEKLANYDLVV